jgi:hypothetical protein
MQVLRLLPPFVTNVIGGEEVSCPDKQVLAKTIENLIHHEVGSH